MICYMETEWDLADRLRKALRHSHLKAGEVAAEMDVSRNTVSGWLAGRHRPRPRDLRMFARITGYDAEWLATGSEVQRTAA